MIASSPSQRGRGEGFGGSQSAEFQPGAGLNWSVLRIAAKRLKLESFDKKMGKQPDFIQHVRLHDSPAQMKPYLPQVITPLNLTQPLDAVLRGWAGV